MADHGPAVVDSCRGDGTGREREREGQRGQDQKIKAPGPTEARGDSVHIGEGKVWGGEKEDSKEKDEPESDPPLR